MFTSYFYFENILLYFVRKKNIYIILFGSVLFFESFVFQSKSKFVCNNCEHYRLVKIIVIKCLIIMQTYLEKIYMYIYVLIL